ncbi:MAG: hypothetical protein WCF85_11205 [Rhodospirillaceae bacterium]
MRAIIKFAALAILGVSSVARAAEPSMPAKPAAQSAVDCQATLKPILAAIKAADTTAMLEATKTLIALKGGPCGAEAEKAAAALQASAGTAVPQMLDLLNSIAVSTAAQAAKDLADKAKPLVQDAATKAETTAKEIAATAKPIVDQVKAKADQVAKDLAEKAKPVVDVVKAKVDDAVKTKPDD